MNKLILGLVVAIGLAGGGFWYFNQTAANQTDIGLSQTSASSDIDTSGVLEMAIGPEDAAVTVVEYASYTCPHCKRFHEDVLPQIKADYVDTGKVRFVYREVYFDRFGLWAGLVARCGGPERFFGITDLIYETQSEWARAGDPSDVAVALRRLGITAGLSGEQVDACMQDGDKAEAMVAVFEANAAADNVRATPSFIINGEPYSNMSYSEFARVLDDKLGE